MTDAPPRGCSLDAEDLIPLVMSARARRLRDLPAARIVASLAGACERWANADFPPRVRATRAVMERMGYSEPVVDYALDRLFEPVTVPALRAVIDNELGSLRRSTDSRPGRTGPTLMHAASIR